MAPWLKEGDNTKFFHHMANARWVSNFINSLKNQWRLFGRRGAQGGHFFLLEVSSKET